MNNIIMVRGEHIEVGKKKYCAIRDTGLEKLLQNTTQWEVFRFSDGRILTINPSQEFGFLYITEEVFFEKIVLT